jgi:hypothetical protein
MNAIKSDLSPATIRLNAVFGAIHKRQKKFLVIKLSILATWYVVSMALLFY